MKVLFAPMLVLAMFLSLTAPGFAFGGGGGDDWATCGGEGGGEIGTFGGDGSGGYVLDDGFGESLATDGWVDDFWCGGERKESAWPLRKSFIETNFFVLLDQRYERTICDNHPCGNFSEDVAADFMDDIIDQIQREKDQSVAWNNMMLSVGVFLVALAGLLLSWRVHRRSVKNESEIGRIKQEVDRNKSKGFDG